MGHSYMVFDYSFPSFHFDIYEISRAPTSLGCGPESGCYPHFGVEKPTLCEVRQLVQGQRRLPDLEPSGLTFS